MSTRLSRALFRVFPAILLVVVTLLAALFRTRRDPQEGGTTLVPIPAGLREPSVRRRGAAIAVLALLLGIGLVLVVLDGDGALRRIVSTAPSADGEGRRPLAALSQADVDSSRRKTSEAIVQRGPNALSEPGGQAAAPALGTPDTTTPAFDTVRVEPNGELVVAGRAPPNGTVELLVDGRATARVVADANGQFAIVPPALPTGNSEVGLRVTDAKGAVRISRDSVAVAVSPSRDAKPLVALTSPDKPTVVLSHPGSTRMANRVVPDATPAPRTMAGSAPPSQPGSVAAPPGAGTSNAMTAAGDAARSSPTENGGNAGSGATDRSASVRAGSGTTDPQDVPSSKEAAANRVGGAPTKIVSVDAQAGGRLFVTGQAATGVMVRLYLNDTMIAPARVGRDGSVTFTIGRGVEPGDYKVRLDEVDAASGKVRSRVEVPFSVPDGDRTPGTDRTVATPSETETRKDDGGTGSTTASRPMISSPATVVRQGQAMGASALPQDSDLGTPAAASSKTDRDPLNAGTDPAVVFVPEVRTARIERGDNLWAISRRTYGDGDRYTAIYDANQDQIRDPDLIYPGQVFVLPSGETIEAGQDGKRG